MSKKTECWNCNERFKEPVLEINESYDAEDGRFPGTTIYRCPKCEADLDGNPFDELRKTGSKKVQK